MLETGHLESLSSPLHVSFASTFWHLMETKANKDTQQGLLFLIWFLGAVPCWDVPINIFSPDTRLGYRQSIRVSFPAVSGDSDCYGTENWFGSPPWLKRFNWSQNHRILEYIKTVFYMDRPCHCYMHDFLKKTSFALQQLTLKSLSFCECTLMNRSQSLLTSAPHMNHDNIWIFYKINGEINPALCSQWGFTVKIFCNRKLLHISSHILGKRGNCNNTQYVNHLLLYSVFGLPRALCNSLTHLSFFLLSLLLCLLLSPSIPVGTLLLNQVFFPLLTQTALSPSFLPLSLSSLSMPWGWCEKKRSSQLLSFSLSLPFTLVHFPTEGTPQTRTHTPPYWGDGWTVPRCGLLYGWPGPSLLLLTRRHTIACGFGPLKGAWRRVRGREGESEGELSVETDEDMMEQRGLRDGRREGWRGAVWRIKRT